ncbi:serine hydrolase [Streptomyces albidoflavus]|jgi:beta-lactamase class A|nr:MULTISPECIES: serine hydrolase [Streptomyces]MBO1285400.1 serine hydrolase [Streptomyces sampsonii]MYX53334.1 serine hydrolase [Streptomyces sp. SID8385]MYX82544.1 serine hydrolase [Streptomyces sp. SID4915]QLA60578.1 serine hydrolase [Streptomyces violascens]SCD43722.1 beta-lactamase class A [Streptomyces sp. IgraMP-1]
MVEDRIRGIFAKAGADGLLHAVPVGTASVAAVAAGTEPGEGEIALGADEPVVIASIFKVLLVLEFARQVAAGQLDPRERVRVTRGDRLGGWGTAGCADDIELSLRDLAFFAMTVSDNSAADLLLARIGLDTVRLLAGELGLDRTRIVGGPRDVLESMLAEVGARDEAEFALRYPELAEERKRRLSALDPLRTNASTPREITRLLRLVWQDEAGPPQACSQVRELMARQAFRHRLVSGFPDGVAVAAKTGTLPGLHMEAGVIRYPDGGLYAVAVFARSRELTASRTEVDAAIGATARIAVDFLRSAGL